jgi:cell division protein ZapA (FtsZ GTPase activity inhibitor)
MSEQLIPINITIADRTYRIKVQPADEEVVRKTVKLINDKVVEFKTNFAGKDMQDYVSMVILWYATQNQEKGQAGFDLEHLTQKLNKLEGLLDKE